MLMTPGSRLKLCLVISIFGCFNFVWTQRQPSLDQLLHALGESGATAAKDQIVKFGDEAIPRLRTLALNGTIRRRLDAVELLGLLGTTEDLDFLISLVSDDAPAIRVPASHAVDQVYHRFVDRVNAQLEQLTNSLNFGTPEEVKAQIINIQHSVSNVRDWGAVDEIALVNWRVRTLNYLKSPCSEEGNALIDSIMKDREDSIDQPLNTNQTAERSVECCGSKDSGDVALELIVSARLSYQPNF